MVELMRASNEWWSRPDDQRYLSLDDLKTAVANRRKESWTAAPSTGSLRAHPGDDGGLVIDVMDPTAGERRALRPTNWAFGQLSQYASAPAGYLRKLPAELAAINLQWGFEANSMRDDSLMLAQSNGDHALRAMTSTSYGRIWDHEVVEAVEKVNEDGRWQIPASTYGDKDPLRATTLYASDRDVFLFLVDPDHPVEVPGEDHPMYRGFYCWNSEVGSSVFGLSTFLYRTVCDNRIVWGATDVKELRIRHTRGAPERFGYEGRKYLEQYAEESTQKIVQQIGQAKAKDIDLKPDESVTDWLRARGFSKGQAKASYETAVAEEGKARTVWDVINGVTAYARSVVHTDARVALEAQAGSLMRYAE